MESRHYLNYFASGGTAGNSDVSFDFINGQHYHEKTKYR